MNTSKAPSTQTDCSSVGKALSQPDCSERKQLQTTIEDRLKKQQFALPTNTKELAQSATSFANDMGYSLKADTKIKSSQLANNLKLQEQIKQLKAELKSEILELKDDSKDYVKAAEDAMKWLQDAQAFMHKHPHIARMLHISK